MQRDGTVHDVRALVGVALGEDVLQERGAILGDRDVEPFDHRRGAGPSDGAWILRLSDEDDGVDQLGLGREELLEERLRSGGIAPLNGARDVDGGVERLVDDVGAASQLLDDAPTQKRLRGHGDDDTAANHCQQKHGDEALTQPHAQSQALETQGHWRLSYAMRGKARKISASGSLGDRGAGSLDGDG